MIRRADSFKTLKREYINTGKIKFVYKDFPLGFHQLAKPAAVAANCVFKELGREKYFEMHNKLFENQKDLSEENFKKWALFIGVDENKYAPLTIGRRCRYIHLKQALTGMTLSTSSTRNAEPS